MRRMIEIIGRLVLGHLLRRANKTEWGGRFMPYKLLLIPFGMLVAAAIFIRIAA